MPSPRHTAFASSTYSGLALSGEAIRTTSPARIPSPPPSAKSISTLA